MALSKMGNKAQLIETSKAITTDWFTTDLVVNEAQQSGEVYKWVFQIHVNTDTVVNLLYTIGGTLIPWAFNNGSAIVADSIYVEEVMIPSNVDTINIQHATTTQNVSVIVGEIREFDSVS
jgi:hypothetical protein